MPDRVEPDGNISKFNFALPFVSALHITIFDKGRLCQLDQISSHSRLSIPKSRTTHPFIVRPSLRILATNWAVSKLFPLSSFAIPSHNAPQT